MHGRAAFEDWYRAEHPRLVSSLLLISGDVDAAQEAADEALARALVRWDRVQAMASPGGWTHRVALNLLRRRKRRESIERRLMSRMPSQAMLPAPAGEAW